MPLRVALPWEPLGLYPTKHYSSLSGRGLAQHFQLVAWSHFRLQYRALKRSLKRKCGLLTSLILHCLRHCPSHGANEANRQRNVGELAHQISRFRRHGFEFRPWIPKFYRRNCLMVKSINHEKISKRKRKVEEKVRKIKAGRGTSDISATQEVRVSLSPSKLLLPSVGQLNKSREGTYPLICFGTKHNPK